MLFKKIYIFFVVFILFGFIYSCNVVIADDYKFKLVVVDCEVDFGSNDLDVVGGISFFNGFDLNFMVYGTCVFPSMTDCFIDTFDVDPVGIRYYGFYFPSFTRNICVLNIVFDLEE